MAYVGVGVGLFVGMLLGSEEGVIVGSAVGFVVVGECDGSLEGVTVVGLTVEGLAVGLVDG